MQPHCAIFNQPNISETVCIQTISRRHLWSSDAKQIIIIMRIRQQSLMKYVCDRLPASLFDWHAEQKKSKKNENRHKTTRTHKYDDRKLCETYFIDIDEPLAEPSNMEICIFFHTLNVWKGLEKNRKKPNDFWMDFDLVSGNEMRMLRRLYRSPFANC